MERLRRMVWDSW